MRDASGITVTIPGWEKPLEVRRVVLDFNGTLARDGKLVRGVGERIRRLARFVDVFVVTSDTYGTAQHSLSSLPVEVLIVRNGSEKRRLVERMGDGNTVAIGNGNNDIPMFEAAALSIGVCGAEGASSLLLGSATIIVYGITDALDLLLKPERLGATLRR